MSFFFSSRFSVACRVRNLRGAEDAREKKQQKSTLPFFEKQNESDDGQKHVARCEVVVFFLVDDRGERECDACAFYVQSEGECTLFFFSISDQKKKD